LLVPFLCETGTKIFEKRKKLKKEGDWNWVLTEVNHWFESRLPGTGPI